jgi:hypothetical protein
LSAHGFIFDGVFGLSLFYLPLLVLMVKIAPKGVEGTTLAILMGVRNMAMSSISPLMGAHLNDAFVGVTKHDME